MMSRQRTVASVLPLLIYHIFRKTTLVALHILPLAYRLHKHRYYHRFGVDIRMETVSHRCALTYLILVPLTCIEIIVGITQPIKDEG